jgi:hypothetical protein
MTGQSGRFGLALKPAGSNPFPDLPVLLWRGIVVRVKAAHGSVYKEMQAA